MSVTGRTATTTACVAAHRSTHEAMKSAGVIGHSGSWSTTGSSASTSAAHPVPMSTWVTPASPSAQAAQATSASPCSSTKGSDPRSVSTTTPSDPSSSYSTSCTLAPCCRER